MNSVLPDLLWNIIVLKHIENGTPIWIPEGQKLSLINLYNLEKWAGLLWEENLFPKKKGKFQDAKELSSKTLSESLHFCFVSS